MVLGSEQSEGEGLPCPRCDSRETKFCYFNNYSTTQPRHFCRNCKRYWTAGGTLRNVPVGGGLRKSKKSKLSKHGRDLLSASTEESLSPGNGILALHASPSSSADGLTDETSAKCVMPLCAYRPTLDLEAGAFVAGGDSYPYSLSPVEYKHAGNFTHCNGANPAGYEQHIHDANQGFFQLRFAAGTVDQAQSSSGEISSEPSQACGEANVLPAIYCPRNAILYNRPNGQGQQAHVTPHGPRHEGAHVSNQSNSQCSVEKLSFPHNGSSRKRSLTEDEDEELGNVINVRYPYDWEQVSEVVFGGTPDFFNMPTF